MKKILKNLKAFYDPPQKKPIDYLTEEKKRIEKELLATEELIKKKYPDLEKVIQPPEIARLISLYKEKEELARVIQKDRVRLSRDKKKNRKHQADHRKRKKEKGLAILSNITGVGLKPLKTLFDPESFNLWLLGKRKKRGRKKKEFVSGEKIDKP